MSATIAQDTPSKTLPEPAEEPVTFLHLVLDDMVPIPMPPQTHPAGDQVHPWED